MNAGAEEGEDQDNFLDRFRGSGGSAEDGQGGAAADREAEADDDGRPWRAAARGGGRLPPGPGGGEDQRRDGEMALPGSWERPLCCECGGDEGDDGGGRYGHGEDSGKFYCGRCWMSWEEVDRRRMMMAYAPRRGRDPLDPMLHYPPPPPPMTLTDEEGLWGRPAWKEAWQEQREEEGEEEEEEAIENYFDQCTGGQDIEDVEGAWDPSQRQRRRDGEMALPGSWQSPICVECGREEGEAGHGRYGHGPDSEKFYCGQCWMSWEKPERDKMMSAYIPSRWLREGHDMPDPMLCEAPTIHCDPPEDEEEEEGEDAEEGLEEEVLELEEEEEEQEDHQAEGHVGPPTGEARGTDDALSSDDAELAD